MNPTIKALSLFLFCAVAVFAQTDNPLCAISNSPTIGQVITATSTGAPATCSWQAGGGGGGSVAIQANGVAVGSQPILNYIPGPGITNTLSDTGTKINIQQGVDTAVIPTIASIQAGPALNCNPASASGTTYTCGLPTALTTYTTGQMLILKPDTNGTGGATTLNIDALGARPIKEWDGTTNPTSSDLVSGRPYFIWNDGTNWRLPYVPAGATTNGSNTNVLTSNGTGGFGTALAVSGSGNVCLTTSCSMTTPILGTPTSGTLTNATGLPEGGLSLTDITTNNASTTKHGFAPKYPNDATKYLDGTGAYSTPASACSTIADVTWPWPQAANLSPSALLFTAVANTQRVFAFHVPGGECWSITKLHFVFGGTGNVAMAITNFAGTSIVTNSAANCTGAGTGNPATCSFAGTVSLTGGTTYRFVITGDATAGYYYDLNETGGFGYNTGSGSGFPFAGTVAIGLATNNSTGAAGTLAVAVPLGTINAVTGSIAGNSPPVIAFQP